MTRLACGLAIVIGVIIGSGPAQAQGETTPISFLKEMLGIRSRPPEQVAPMSLAAPRPAPAKTRTKADAKDKTPAVKDKNLAAKDKDPASKDKSKSAEKAQPTRTAKAQKPKAEAKHAAAAVKAPATSGEAAVAVKAPVTTGETAAADKNAEVDTTASTHPVKTEQAASQTAAAIDARPAATPIPEKKPAVRLPAFRGGGSLAVCVRSCDGYFFPVNYEGAHSNDRYAEACQLACPAAATEVYFMPRGGDLKQAATQTGQRYSAMPAAFRYRKERDASCSCKAQDQSWAEVLAQADTLVKRGPNDIVVTPQRSLELARPVDPAVAEAAATAAPAPKKTAGKKAKGKAVATKAKPAPDTTWKTTNRFVKIDPEPTASISIR